jgi:hypothetical protein
VAEGNRTEASMYALLEVEELYAPRDQSGAMLYEDEEVLAIAELLALRKRYLAKVKVPACLPAYLLEFG